MKSKLAVVDVAATASGNAVFKVFDELSVWIFVVFFSLVCCILWFSVFCCDWFEFHDLASFQMTFD